VSVVGSSRDSFAAPADGTCETSPPDTFEE
jgi:hypothetical protein